MLVWFSAMVNVLEDVIVGASLTSVTVTVTDCDTDAVPSLTVTVDV